MDAFINEIGEDAFDEWLAFEMLERGQAAPTEEDLPGIAYRNLQAAVRGRR